MILTHSVKVCLAVEPCDMRKGYNGLSALVANQLKEDPLSGKLFVFTNRSRVSVTPSSLDILWRHASLCV